MRLHGLFLLAVFSLAFLQLVKGQSLPRCQTTCGNVTIEYPFGTSPDCFYADDPSFKVTCNKEGKLIFGTNIEIINMSHKGELRVKFNRSYTCYDSQGDWSGESYYNYTLGNSSLSSNNRFTLVGCNAYAIVTTFGRQGYSTGCMSLCNSRPAQNTNCNGQGCCTTDVSMPLDKLAFRTRSSRFANTTTSVYEYNRCTYAFLVENGQFNFSSTRDLWNLRSVTDFPVVLDWSIGKQTCEQVVGTSSYICSENSECFNSTRGTGYICKCRQGFEGNPYLRLRGGCKDIDECVKTDINKHNCSTGSTCKNMPGSFDCG